MSEHPLTPTDRELQAAIDDLAKNLRNVGATVVTESDLLPDLDAAARLYVRLLNSSMAVFLSDEVMAHVQAAVAKIDRNDKGFMPTICMASRCHIGIGSSMTPIEKGFGLDGAASSKILTP